MDATSAESECLDHELIQRLAVKATFPLFYLAPGPVVALFASSVEAEGWGWSKGGICRLMSHDDTCVDKVRRDPYFKSACKDFFAKTVIPCPNTFYKTITVTVTKASTRTKNVLVVPTQTILTTAVSGAITVPYTVTETGDSSAVLLTSTDFAEVTQTVTQAEDQGQAKRDVCTRKTTSSDSGPTRSNNVCRSSSVFSVGCHCYSATSVSVTTLRATTTTSTITKTHTATPTIVQTKLSTSVLTNVKTSYIPSTYTTTVSTVLVPNVYTQWTVLTVTTTATVMVDPPPPSPTCISYTTYLKAHGGTYDGKYVRYIEDEDGSPFLGFTDNLDEAQDFDYRNNNFYRGGSDAVMNAWDSGKKWVYLDNHLHPTSNPACYPLVCQATDPSQPISCQTHNGGRKVLQTCPDDLGLMYIDSTLGSGCTPLALDITPVCAQWS